MHSAPSHLLVHWNRVGTILFYGGSNTLASTSASGGEVVQATERNIALFDENHFTPAFLPDGQHYLLLVRGGPDLQFQVWVGALGSNERRLLLKDVSNARSAPPHGGRRTAPATRETVCVCLQTASGPAGT